MYEGERKRSQKTIIEKPKITFMQGLKLWANQWRWSEIRRIWARDYTRVYTETMYRMDKVNEKLGR